MSTIRLSRKHNLGAVEVRAKVDEVAESLNRKFGVSCSWRGDCLHLERAGAAGTIDVGSKELVIVDVKLGIPLRPMKAAIESSIQKGFDRVMDPAGGS